ncbi:MAG: hypothetical protein CL824_02260 [Crocinitomicaceae bacterium]|nr:hypothetical protein [Crocinitomicaceae bacterium]
MIKKTIKKIVNIFGYDFKKFNKKDYDLSFDEILKKNLPNDPIIFDVGANKGQSIEKYLKLFDNPTIHSFEPIKDEIHKLEKKYQKNTNIYLNNLALGEKNEIKDFYITAKSDNSSFNKLNLGTEWLKIRSKQNNTNELNYVKKVEKVKISTLDEYVKLNNIDKIDLIKIDTQGYEDKVLEGSLNSIKNNKISVIQTEIMLDNNYKKYFSFSDLEKLIVPYNFRMVGIDMVHNNLFSGLIFAGDIMYFNKKKFKI